MPNKWKKVCETLGWIALALALVVVIMILLVLGFQGGVVLHDHLH